MKKLIYILIFIITNSVFSQSNGIAKSIGVYVFPNNNQTTETQNKDESVCYKWAMDQTGYDPMNPTVATAAAVDTSPDGSAIVGSAKGAAAGAALGSIGGEMGKGAAVGAILGGLAGRRQKRMHDEHEKQANANAASGKNTEMENNYKKAFRTCLEAKGYTAN